MSAAFLYYGRVYDEEPNFTAFAAAMYSTALAALCGRLADEEPRAGLYARHGLLLLEEGREYEFEKNPFEFEYGLEAYRGVSYEWEGILRTAGGLADEKEAYGEAMRRYEEFVDVVAMEERVGWCGEPEFDHVVHLFETVGRGGKYPEWKSVLHEISGPSFVTRIERLREHFPKAVDHLLKGESWSSQN